MDLFRLNRSSTFWEIFRYYRWVDTPISRLCVVFCGVVQDPSEVLAGCERIDQELSSGSEERRVSEAGHTGAAEGFVDQSQARVGVPCPECGSDRPRRLERKGFLQMKVYPVFGYYPWMCGACKTSFLARKRYRRKSKRTEEYISRDTETKD
jgi:hypothetical protein